MRRRIEGFFFAPASPVNAGVLRIGLFGATVWFAAQEDTARDAAAAAINWRPTSFFRILPAAPSDGAIRAVQIAVIVVGTLAAIGLWTRVTQRVATPLAAFLLGFDSSFGKINHRSMLLVLLLVAVLPARTGDAVSVDRLMAVARRRQAFAVEPSPAYRWPVALAQTTIVSVYFFAGISKLVNGGATWFTADAFRRFLYVRLDQLPDPPKAGLWVAAHPAVAQAAAVASVAFELSVALVLVYPALKKLILPGLVAFHESTRRLTRINFTRTLLVAWIPLVDWERLGLRVRTRFSRPKDVVLYDGGCRLCRRSAAVLATLDVLRRLEFLNARDAVELARRFPQLDPASCLKDMHIVSGGGGIYAGFFAYRRLASVVPLGWPMLWALYVPGSPALGKRLYRRVADSRLPLLHCAGDACEVEHHAETPVVRTGSL
ncbi:MAG: DUF393 domain-containing protein [Actinobacteria bacterium]|nr:DUF393 domain-containing protein [Actinomycetota bacterium]